MKKPSVGIVTVHYVDNLGGALLAFALQEAVSRLGYDAQIIDFDPTPLPTRTTHTMRSLLHRMRRLPKYLESPSKYLRLLAQEPLFLLPSRHPHGSVGVRGRRFASFRSQQMKLTPEHYSSSKALEESPPVFDVYVCGSDQIWNPFLCREDRVPRNERAYFLTFAKEAKRVSYAPSISVPQIPPDLRGEMTELLRGIPYLSCRELQGAELIRELSGRPAEVVLDPTLLLSNHDWSSLAIQPRTNGEYILCYFLGEGLEYRDFAVRLKEITGWPLIVISRRTLDLREAGALDYSHAGPREFLGLVKNARLICTDSYHGTLFSINFEKPFFVFERPGSSGGQSSASRIHSILALTGLTTRLKTSEFTIPEDPSVVDFLEVRQRVEEQRERSLMYLKAALQRASSNR